MYTFDGNIVSDLHKDAYGFRPREYFWAEWNNSSDADKQHIWDHLIEDLELEISREKREQELAMESFRAYVQKAYAWGAPDLIAALKWIFEAEQFSDNDLRYGADYVCFHFGLNYTEGKKAFPFQQVCNEMLAEVV